MLGRLAVVSLVSVLSLASTAQASPSFPEAVQEHLDLSCKPDCTNCHTRPEGGIGTARQPFGLAMQQGGLRAAQPEKIAAALDHLESIASDVDGDGVPDTQELRDGTNPNAADEPLKCYDDGGGDDGGCTVKRARPDALATSLAIVAGLLLLARKRRDS